MFELEEITVAQLKTAYASGVVSCHEVVQSYIDRIERFDAAGPGINSIITVNPAALDEAEVADARLRRTGLQRVLEGIPVILKDQIDCAGMPTTLGSVLFKDFFPDRDATVVTKLKEAGALILAKATLGELGAGDAHGTLYGSTRNPYDRDRTAGGSSGGPAAAMSCNFGTIAVGQEGFASIRRPASWNCTVGMRPTSGLVSRSGSYHGGPSVRGVLGPMTRSVEDLAVLLDVLVGYDPEDASTALSVGKTVPSYSEFLRPGTLRGARLGILRDSIGFMSEPSSSDFDTVDRSFEFAVQELTGAGAVVVDPTTIPNIRESFQHRYPVSNVAEATFAEYFGRNKKTPFATAAELDNAIAGLDLYHDKTRVVAGTVEEGKLNRERLFIALLKVMTDLKLDAIVHKSVEHQPTLIADGVNPPYVNQKGAPYINTFLEFASSITVPAGFTGDHLPTGITFLGRPYDEGRLIGLAFDYEQLTQHRTPPDLAV